MPFTVEQFFDIFGIYNMAIWPAQVIAYVIGMVAIALVVRENVRSSEIISAILALYWMWTGILYHMACFSAINSAGRIFGIFWVIQGVLFLLVGVIYPRLSFRFRYEPLPIIGACFILYAMVGYDLLGRSLGHVYPRVPLFGVTPCPTTIFTFGLLLWATKPVPLYLLLIPFLWSMAGTSAAVSLGVPQDYGLTVAGGLGTVLILIQNRKAERLAQTS